MPGDDRGGSDELKRLRHGGRVGVVAIVPLREDRVHDRVDDVVSDGITDDEGVAVALDDGDGVDRPVRRYTVKGGLLRRDPHGPDISPEVLCVGRVQRLEDRLARAIPIRERDRVDADLLVLHRRGEPYALS